MDILHKFGWNDFFNNHYINCNPGNDLNPGRVISLQGMKYHVVTRKGELECELSGKLLYGTEPELLPRVGDWVYYLDYESMGYIVDIFPRQNALSRRAPGTKTERQVIAANIDFALVIQGLDRDFNIMRIDRYLVQIMACGIAQVVVLNKADLVEDVEPFRREIARLGRECPVYFCSTYNGSGLDELKSNVLKPLKTHIFVGSSGVGKSSIINSLAGDYQLKTNTLSHSTNKGRHTTTTRDLFVAPNGSLVIDTPGMREFGMALDDDLAESGLFPEIEKYAKDCRYTDCRHLVEEGCAVIRAYESGALDPKVYASYLKLVKEQQHFEIRVEDKKRLGKQFGKMVREVKAFKEKNK